MARLFRGISRISWARRTAICLGSRRCAVQRPTQFGPWTPIASIRG